MQLGKLSNFFWRAVFTVSYTAVVLPFAVNFLKSIASPSSTETLMLMIPLGDAHNFMLPVFLVCFEFASIQLACSFWAMKHHINRYLILIIFLACQAFAVTSVYYDIRIKDFPTMKNTVDIARTESVESLRNTVSGLKEQAATVSAELNKIRRDRDSNDIAIDKWLARMSKEKISVNKEPIRVEIQNKERFREKREREIDDLIKQKRVLDDDLKKKQSELEAYIKDENKGLKYKSELEFIVKEVFTYKGGFAAAFVSLFPISILGVAFILPKNSNADAGVLSSFDLKEHLRNAASLPENMHFNYVKLLVPSLDAYLSALKASKKILNENDALNLHTSLIRQIINEVKGLQEQIALSKLEENSKSYMLNELNNLLNQQLTVKEEMSHV
ncbi:MAG: hypothetical protein L6246_07725 [Thermodesulfovibrionales bacterium]|nr:hypothetical protein [Thermodesulfovibrionales bacterium]